MSTITKYQVNAETTDVRDIGKRTLLVMKNEHSVQRFFIPKVQSVSVNHFSRRTVSVKFGNKLLLSMPADYFFRYGQKFVDAALGEGAF